MKRGHSLLLLIHSYNGQKNANIVISLQTYQGPLNLKFNNCKRKDARQQGFKVVTTDYY